MKYECPCGYVYDPAVGDPDSGIAPGTAWEDIPEDWVCSDEALFSHREDGAFFFFRPVACAAHFPASACSVSTDEKALGPSPNPGSPIQ